MNGLYWFIRYLNSRQITVCFVPGLYLDNMNTFLAMSRHSELRRILDDLTDYNGGMYFATPGEYLELFVANGTVTARISLGDGLPCRMDVDFFRHLVTDYLAEWEHMRRELDIV